MQSVRQKQSAVNSDAAFA